MLHQMSDIWFFYTIGRVSTVGDLNCEQADSIGKNEHDLKDRNVKLNSNIKKMKKAQKKRLKRAEKRRLRREKKRKLEDQTRVGPMILRALGELIAMGSISYI